MKTNQWQELVFESDEYEHLTYAERALLAANPKSELSVKYLLEVDEVYAIFHNGKKIGFFIQVQDHVQAAIYQDGAWIDMFLDIEQNVLRATDESA